MTLAPWVLEGELLLMMALLLPLGLFLVNLGEHLLARRPRLPIHERLLVALYLSGGVLYVLASLTLPLFGEGLVVLLAGLGGLAWVASEWAGWWLTPAKVWSGLVRPHVGLLAAVFLLLLYFESAVLGAHPFPNTYDGSVQALYVRLLLSKGTVAWTLLPYANMGVAYPQGTAVWMATGVVLLGWSPATAPVYLPSLFLSLSMIAAYSWGSRLQGIGTPRGTRGGTILALVVGLVGTWPRFLVGGSYDFVLGFPLFLLLLSWMPALVTPDHPRWGEMIAYGGLVGILASLSVVAAELLVVLLLVMALATHRDSLVRMARWIAATSTVAVLGALFVVRDLIAVEVWWGYPNHVLTPLGPDPWQPPHSSALAWAIWVGLVDPFLFRVQDVWLSPFPLLKLELALLLSLTILGLAMGGLNLVRFPSHLVRPAAVYPLGVLLVSTLALLTFLVIGSGSWTVLLTLSSVTNYRELSIILFFGYVAMATLPLMAAAEWLELHRPPSVRATLPFSSQLSRRLHPRPLTNLLGLIVASALLVVPLVSGAVVTTTEGPGYLGEVVQPLSNVTSGDLAALEWSAALPSCSNVLVAPGSAAEFLPVYSSTKVTFPLVPFPLNRSYWQAVTNLSWGNYTPSVKADIESLGVTEVFVTGQSNVLWRPFEPQPLLASSDFAVLFHNGDAFVLDFGPGSARAGCPVPTAATY